MLSDFSYIFTWWLTYLILGLVSLPLTVILFKNFYDKGYIFGKIITSVLVTYIAFVLGVFHLLPYTGTTLFLIILSLLTVNAFYLSRPGNLVNFKQLFRSKLKIFLAQEIVFFLALAAWSYVRGFAPNLEGLEKFMDWGFVNSALRSTYLPPVDMWFAKEPINYYYFGHLVVATLTKLSGIPSAVTYNLAIASTCALTFTATFSLVSNLIYSYFSNKKKIVLSVVAGIISSLLITFGGNLHAAYKIAKTDIAGNQGKLVLSSSAVKKAASAYWYPDATRFIGFDPETKDKTIHEFPLYSFVVSDLHGHMNDIPNVLLLMAVLFSVITISSPWFLVLPLSFLLSINFMTNAWDIAVYGLFFAVFFFIFNLVKNSFKYALANTFLYGIQIIALWFLFTLPFSLHFTPMAQGLRLADAHSPFYQLFILYGGFWLICFPFIFYLIFKFVKYSKSDIKNSDIFVLSLITLATLLVIIPEVGYIKDIYIYEHRRANTMFKLVYEAFIMYSVASGYVVIRLLNSVKSKLLSVIYALIFIIVFSIHLIYPYFAINSYYGNFQSYKGLWGLNWLKDSYPDNLAAVDWINNNIQGQPVMLEAVGDSYTTFNQISVATGLPTVEGWIVHEWLWRDGYDKPAARQADVKNIYEAKDLKQVRTLLQKYSVDYIFVGDKEREKYPALNETNFKSLGAQIVFESGNTRIYKLIK